MQVLVVISHIHKPISAVTGIKIKPGSCVQKPKAKGGLMYLTAKARLDGSHDNNTHRLQMRVENRKHCFALLTSGWEISVY